MTASRKPVRVRPATLDDMPFLMALSQELKKPAACQRPG